MDNAMETMLADRYLSIGDHHGGSDCDANSGMGEQQAAVVLTGATGFLGRHLLSELLVAGTAPIICLVRGNSQQAARTRLRRVMATLGGADDDHRRATRLANFDRRVDVVAADLSQPRCGLSQDQCARLVGRVDTVFHAAATVNWIKSYEQLRQGNVLATARVIELCFASKAGSLVFVSTLAVCFARGAPDCIDESDNPLRWIRGMPLGYAQSKCIAECLLRRAAAGGLAVSIMRPGLLAGDTQSGAANPKDILCAVIRGCAQLGRAPDADWVFDSIPVDYCASAIVALGRKPRQPLSVYHLRHPKPRHWRELVLWLNLMGHPIRLVPTSAWLRRAFGAARERIGTLAGHRRFFLGEPNHRVGSVLPFEVYLAEGQAAVRSEWTDNLLAMIGLRAPAMGQELLSRYIGFFESVGILPAQPGATGAPAVRWTIPAQLSQQIQTSVSSASATTGWAWREVDFDCQAGLLNDVTSMVAGVTAGLRRYRLDEPGTMKSADIVVKLKATDRELTGAIIQVAKLHTPDLAEAIERFPRVLGLDNCHLREPQIYRDAPASVRRYMPRCLGHLPIDGSKRDTAGHFGVAIEHVAGGAGKWQPVSGWNWSEQQRQLAIRALAALHGGWSCAGNSAVAKFNGLCPPINHEEATRMVTTWRALATLAQPAFAAAGLPELTETHFRLVDSIGDWWRRHDDLPKSLIHNDFNPRNVLFENKDNDSVIRVIDWELATVGPPQQDLAELLCFALPTEASASDVHRDLELHRILFTEQTKSATSSAQWRTGFNLSLNRFLLHRLPLYVLVNRFQPQPFLCQLIRNWSRLQRWTEDR